jgi:hypothetical protein
MDELMDMIISDQSPSEISDKIKDILFAKSSENIDGLKPSIASNIFNDQEYGDENEEE